MSFPFKSNNIPIIYNNFWNQTSRQSIYYNNPDASVVFPPPPSAERIPELTMQATIVRLGEQTTDGHIIQGVTIPWGVILKELESDPDVLNKLSPRKFEELIAAAYATAGWIVELTPPSGDRGRDVIAIKPSFCSIRIIEQVKRYTKGYRVTANDVRALAGVLSLDQNVSKGIVTTTSDFAPGVYEEFKPLIPYRLDLRNGTQLLEWLKAAQKLDGKEQQDDKT